MSSIKDLEKKITFHRHKYWEENDPIISDYEYDLLLEQLKKLDSNNSLLTQIEFNHIYDGEKVYHTKPMLSLDKVYEYDEIKNWLLKVARNENELFTISPKYDGISAKYYSKNNILATRGNGEVGENITNKLPLLEFLTKDNNQNRTLIGEIIISIDEFNNCGLKRQDGKKYATPRNLVAGIMNLKDISNITGKINLKFIEHSYISGTFKYSDFDREYWNSVLEHIETVKKTYPLDGIVLQLNDSEYSESLGVTAHHPRGKIAFKFEDKFQFSTLKSITFQMGKRKLTPVANIDPINLNGVIIKKVTLHNAKMLIDNDIHIGDQFKIIRAGDVIPYVAGVKKGETRTPIRLDECPYCGSTIRYIEPDLFCTNSDCLGTTSKQLFESIKTLGIEGVGLTTVEKLMDNIGIIDIIDFINITKEDIIDLPDFGETSSTNLISNIQKVKDGVEDFKILAALNIKSIGKNLSKNILKRYTLKELLNVSYYDLEDINGIGQIRATEIINDISFNKKLIIELINSFKIIETKNKNEVSNGTICFSGTFPLRKEHYQNLAKSAGFTITDNVTKDLSYLVTAGAATGKVNKAKDYRIPILKIDDFMNLIKK